MDKKKIPVFYAFARSGGTLINRCIGCMKGNVVLSEVNPYFSVVSIEKQAKDWFSLISETEYQLLLKESYANKIDYILTKTQSSHKKLIIRDWVTVNFLANCLGDDTLIPSQVLEQKLYLSHHEFKICPVVISRNSADVYESLKRTFIQFSSLSIDEFGIAYLKYAEAVCKYPIFHYESICEKPDITINKICNVLDISYDSCFVNHFIDFTNCTGDNTLNQLSRGYKHTKITSLSSNKNSPNYIAAMQNENCRQADYLLKYD